MRLSPNGWSNDLPNKPGWYLVLNAKDWRWLDNPYPYPVRVDYVNGELMVVEDPEREHEGMIVREPRLPAPLEFDPGEDQSWMRRAYKPIHDVSEFDRGRQEDVDVVGIRGYASDESNAFKKRWHTRVHYHS